MMRVLNYVFLAALALLLQTVLLPPFFPGGVKPDLVLLLTIWIGLRESPWRGGLLIYGLGWLYDAYAGTFPGLHGFVLLTVFLVVSGMATRLNTESLPLLWCLIVGGTLLQGALTVFAIEFFADTEQFWAVMLHCLPAQILFNLLAGYLLRTIGLRFPKAAERIPPGLLPRLPRRYES
ncbi:MAG: rod shape-determining protein MreD [Desulfuromonadales bacterium]